MTGSHLAAGIQDPGGLAKGFLIWAAIIGVYWIPSIAASRRKVRNRGSVYVINTFLGWTFIGWVVALAMAMRDPPPVPPSRPEWPNRV
jgi:hypothetical protein